MNNKPNYLIKPVFDFLISVISLPVVIPVLVIISMLLIIPNKGRIFFLQTRTGKNGRLFKVIKFRTLIENPNKKHQNKIRHFLRETHFDELPQIFNVLKADMSVVGPRPLLPEYQQYYDSKTAKHRITVKPGITGLTQISGGKYLPWGRRFSLDLFYISHISFSFDLMIICRTLNVFSKFWKIPQYNQISNDISFIDYMKGSEKK